MKYLRIRFTSCSHKFHRFSFNCDIRISDKSANTNLTMSHMTGNTGSVGAVYSVIHQCHGFWYSLCNTIFSFICSILLTCLSFILFWPWCCLFFSVLYIYVKWYLYSIHILKWVIYSSFFLTRLMKNMEKFSERKSTGNLSLIIMIWKKGFVGSFHDTKLLHILVNTKFKKRYSTFRRFFILNNHSTK